MSRERIPNDFYAEGESAAVRSAVTPLAAAHGVPVDQQATESLLSTRRQLSLWSRMLIFKTALLKLLNKYKGVESRPARYECGNSAGSCPCWANECANCLRADVPPIKAQLRPGARPVLALERRAAPERTAFFANLKKLWCFWAWS